MEMRSGRSNSDESEALEPIELPVVRGSQSVHPYFAQEESPLFHYWRVLLKRKWWILATVAIIFALSVLRTLRTTRLYQATSKVAIFPENPNVLGFKDVENGFADNETELSLETQAAILRSNALAMKVIEAMHLDQDPRFAGVRQAAPSNNAIGLSSMEPDPARIAGLQGAFRGGLSVQLIPNSRLVQISYTHPDPRLAAEIVNGLVKTYIEANFRTKYESVTQTSEWLSTELADLQLKVQTSEEKLVRYQKDHSILGIDEKQNIVTAKLDELNRELTAAQSDRLARLGEARHGHPVAAAVRGDRGHRLRPLPRADRPAGPHPAGRPADRAHAGALARAAAPIPAAPDPYQPELAAVAASAYEKNGT